MAYDFGADWAADVEAVTSSPEFQNAEITVLSPGFGEYDIETDAWTGDAPTVIVAATRARVIGINQTNNVAGSVTENPTGVRRIRVQFPFSTYPARINPGSIVRVLDGGRNPALETYLIKVISDNLSSQRASHTLECETNVEVVAAWSP